MSHHIITFTVGLLAILNPIGNAAIYLGMIENYGKIERRNIVLQCTLGIIFILLLSVWAGPFLLSFFGISIGAFQSAGGLIVLLIALDMMRAKQHSNTHDTQEDKQCAKGKDNIAIVPLAIPIIAGPGAISAIIANMHQFPGFAGKATISVIALICSIILAIVLFGAPIIANIMGHSGMRIVTRVMGLILAAIAFQMIGSGLIALLPGLAS